MKNLINITAVAPGEIDKLRELSVNCFVQSFGDLNTAEDMAIYLEHSLSRKKLLTELEMNDSSFYFISYADELIGYYKLNTGLAQTEPFNAENIELERIYILNKFQGKNIGQHVLDHIVKTAQALGWKYLWLGVWEYNMGAIRLYKKNGFVTIGSHEFMLGNDRQTDILMKKILSK